MFSLQRPEASGLVCLLCEIEMEEIAAHEPKNFTLKELEAQLESVCAKIPAVSKECDAFVVLYGKDIFEAVSGNTPAGQV